MPRHQVTPRDVLNARDWLHEKLNRDILWNLVSLGVLGAGGIVVNAVVFRFFGSDTLGVFNQVYALYIILSQISVGGLQFSVLKHVSYHQDDRSACADIVTAALLLVSGGSLVLSAVVYPAAGFVGALLDSSEVTVGLRAVLPGILFFSANKVLIMSLNGLRHMRAYAVFRSLRYLLLPLCILGALGISLPPSRLPLSLTVTEGVLFVGLLGVIGTRILPLRLRSGVRQWIAPHLSFGSRGHVERRAHRTRYSYRCADAGLFCERCRGGPIQFRGHVG